MKKDTWARVKALFDGAVALPAADRAAFLERNEPNADIRREAAELLASHDASGGFLETPPDVAAHLGEWPAEADEFAGVWLGPYRLDHRVGAGGMGVVYHAVRDDAEFSMDVAIKIIKRGMDSDDIVRRFRDERQTLARLAHPNIAKLLDGGTTDGGRPYLVMEYVRGAAIDKYCDEHRLSVRDRLRLFIAVLRAVQHAHQNLVIHRDLKPDNILVTSDGVPKLVDFGIARVLDPGADASVTRLVERRMTLAYASPEQVRGEPMSTTSDVYSLGMILYELVAGRRPHRERLLTPAAYEKAIDDGVLAPSARVNEYDTRTAPHDEDVAHAGGDRSDDARPIDVSAARRTTVAGLTRQLAGDLDTIILKSIETESLRRYASVQEFADDLERFLEGRPILARPASWRYRVQKFVGRHRAGVAAMVFVTIAVAAGIAGTLWQWRNAQIERDRARAEASRAKQISDFIVGVLRSADPEEQGRSVTVAAALDQAIERAERDLADQPDELATIRVTIGSTLRELGQLDKGLALIERGVALRRKISGPSPELVEAISQLGGTYEDRGDLARAQPLYDEALAMARNVYGSESPLVVSHMRNVSSLHMRGGEFDEAEAMDREILALSRRLPNIAPDDLAESINNLAVVVGTRGRWDEAVTLQKEALDLVERVHGLKHPDVAAAITNYATSLESSGNYDEAEKYYRQALALRSEILGDDHPSTAFTRYNFAMMLTDRHKVAPATVLIDRVLALRGNVLPDSHPLVGGALQIKGRLELAQGRYAQAEALFRESLKVREASLPPGHWLIASSKGFLGECLAAEGRFAEARTLLAASRTELAAAVGPGDKRTQQADARLSQLEKKTEAARKK